MRAKNNEDFGSYIVNERLILSFGAYYGQSYILIDRHKTFAKKNSITDYIAEDGYVFRRIRNRRDDAIAPAVHLIMIH